MGRVVVNELDNEVEEPPPCDAKSKHLEQSDDKKVCMPVADDFEPNENRVPMIRSGNTTVSQPDNFLRGVESLESSAAPCGNKAEVKRGAFADDSSSF